MWQSATIILKAQLHRTFTILRNETIVHTHICVWNAVNSARSFVCAFYLPAVLYAYVCSARIKPALTQCLEYNVNDVMLMWQRLGVGLTL